MELGSRSGATAVRPTLQLRSPRDRRRVLGLLSLWTAALFLFAACEPAGQLPPALRAYPQLILYNGKILTMDRDDAGATVAEALAIRDGRILAVGKKADILKLAGPQTQKEDLGGKTVIPGIIDTHTHIQEYALKYARDKVPALQPVLVQGRNWAEIKQTTLETIKREAAKRGPAEWILISLPARAAGSAGNVVDVKIPVLGEFITANDIDAVAPQNPVHIEGQVVGVWNSKALDLMKAFYGGRDEEIRPSGVMESLAVRRAVYTDMIAKDDGIIQEAFKRELQEWAGYGVTTWSSSLSALRDLTNFAALDRKGQLAIRLAYTDAAGVSATGNAAEYYRHVGAVQGVGSEMLWSIGVSVVSADSTYPVIGTSIPAPEAIKARELSRFEPGKYRRGVIEAALASGHRVAGLHIAGDRTLDYFMDMVEEQSRARGMTDEQIRAMRHASDHCTANPRPEQFERLKRLGIIMSCGPKYLERIPQQVAADYGRQYARYVVPVKSLLDAGVKVVYESDADDLDRKGPLHYLKLLVTRKYEKEDPVVPEERVDRMTALRMATRWAAEYVLREKELGSLEPGKWADLVLLDRDYTTVPAEQISDIKVLKTLVGGKVVYARR